ncbi:hypothetical protein MMC30_004253 [Trapelia coarctata]|nr:hypothetical protein [Trapelia coarctata]
MVSKRAIRSNRAAKRKQDVVQDIPSHSHNLCARCKSMDIKSLFRGEKSSYGLGLLTDVTRKRNCVLCTFLIETLDTDGRGLPESVWDIKLKEMVPTRCKVTAKALQIANKAKRDAAPNYEFRFQTNGDHPLWSRPIHLLESNTAWPSGPFPKGRGRLIPPVIDTARVEHWLRACESRHPSCRAGDFPDLRMVDLERKCLVLAPKPCRYVTLSYIWGEGQLLTLTTDNRKVLHTEGSLTPDTEGLARTIRDAMMLTKSINERYLWVDSLCIMQDDDAEKSTQIKAMDLVYECSTLTIVGCHGIDANAGLPGIRPDSRLPKQPTCTVDGLQMKLCMPSLRQCLNNAKWMTRGWTYQEEVLSNRLLYVTDGQVHYKCKAGCQACEESTSDLLMETSVTGDILPWGGSPDSIRDNFTIYADFVSIYTGRDLSNPHDSLNAISGIFHRLQATYGGYPFVFGLPTAAFDSALLWEPTRTCRRRLDAQSGKPIFPSWTWAGWEGQVDFRGKYNSSEILRSKITWGEEKNHSDTMALTSRIQDRKWERRVDRGVINYKERGTKEDTIRYNRPVSDENISAIRKAIEPGTGHLRFLAQTALFTCLQTPPSNPPDHPENEPSTLSVLDAHGVHAGTVRTTSPIPPSRDQTLEFLALSRTTLTHDFTDPSWDHSTQSFLYPPQECPPLVSRKRVVSGQELEIFDRAVFDMYKLWPLYNVLLIGWKEGVAYRLGSGKVHVDAFDRVARRKEMVLG